MRIKFVICSLVLGMAVPVQAAQVGAIAPLVGDEVRPDPRLRYRTVFPVSNAPTAADKVNPSLEKVARYLNLLAREGIRTQPGDIVVIVSGGATPAVKQTANNPNRELIAQLQGRGVIVAVCAQALYGHKIDHNELLPGIRVDLSAMTTLAILQLQGWAVITD